MQLPTLYFSEAPANSLTAGDQNSSKLQGCQALQKLTLSYLETMSARSWESLMAASCSGSVPRKDHTHTHMDFRLCKEGAI